MKTAAVICEFNPFHNGHAYILKQARELTGADYIIAIMSGNYVQRGEPAIFDKYTRTQMALKAGADLVIELPQVFAVSSAMEFARAGVITAIKTGVVDYLVFGTEFDADIEEMKKCAGYLLNESSEFQQRIKELVKTGISYPAAREQALSETSDINADYLKSSNNILALSYISALIEENSSIIPVPVKRLGDGYNEIFAKDDHYASATAIRNILLTASSHPNSAKKINKLLTSFIPSEVFELYLKAIEESGILNPAYINKSERLNFILGWRLIEEAAKDDPSFRAYNDVSKEISDRLINTANTFTTMSGRIQAVKTKQYTYSRIQRALLHILLNITDEEVVRRKEAGYIEYLRVLGFKKNAAELMKQIKKSDYREACPMITNAADYRQLLKDDILRDNIYYSLDAGKGILNKSECERQIIIL